MAAPQPPNMTLAHEAFCQGDYEAITAHLKRLENTRGDGHGTMKFAPFITAYQNSERKSQTVACAPDVDKLSYQVCEIVPNTIKLLPAGLGGLAIITSPLQNASKLAQGPNDWHAAVVMRKGRNMWIFDPAFDLDDLPKDGLLSRARGLIIAQNIWTAIGQKGARIENVYVQGMREVGELSCLGRSIQFVERFLDGTIEDPFAADQWLRLDTKGVPQ